MMKYFLAVLSILILGACASQVLQPSDELPTEAPSITCQDPRPQICTMNYLPVCGEISDGTHKTFSNGCGACALSNVESYEPGECPQL